MDDDEYEYAEDESEVLENESEVAFGGNGGDDGSDQDE